MAGRFVSTQLGIVASPEVRGIPTPRSRRCPNFAVLESRRADGRPSGGHQPSGRFRRMGMSEVARSQVGTRMLRYHVVEDRRVKNPRKTLNDRRLAGTAATDGSCAEPLDLPAPDGPRSLSEELLRLACLRQAGLITDYEFDHEKSLMLDRCRHQPEADERQADPEGRCSSRHRSEQH
jgi:hypothetical protein